MVIQEFRGVHRFLSNFFPCNIEYAGLKFGSVEHAYQYAKFELNPTVREKILKCITPGDAKRASRLYSSAIRKDWNSVKLQIMEQLLREKFSDKNLHLKISLIQTGDEEIVEGNKWGDTFWGVDMRIGKGENNLGKLLMEIREEIK